MINIYKLKKKMISEVSVAGFMGSIGVVVVKHHMV